MDLKLIDAGEVEFNGVFDGADVDVGVVDFGKGGVEGGGFSGAGGAGDEDEAVGLFEDFFVIAEHFVGEAEFLKVHGNVAVIDDADDGFFTVFFEHRGDAEIDGAAFEQDMDAAVLGEAAFGNVESGHDFDAADDGGVHVVRGADFFVEAAIDAVADAGFLFIGLDVNVGSAFADGVVDEVVDELDDGGVAGDFLEVADVFDLGFDEGEILGADFIDDVVDDEDVGGGEVGLQGVGDVALGGGDDLDGVAGELLDFFDEEEVGGFGEGDGEDAVDEEHGEDGMFFEEFAREDIDDAGVADFGGDFGVGDAVDFGEGFAKLFFGDEALFDEDFAEKFLSALGFLQIEHGIDGGLGEETLGDEQLPDGFSFGGCCDHVRHPVFTDGGYNSD